MRVIHADFGEKDEDFEDPAVVAREAHPSGKGIPEGVRALLEAKKWSARIEIARDGYAHALADCRRLGISNSEIARTIGKSETAVRNHFKRKARS